MAEPNLQGLRLLVVEDEYLIAADLSDYLRAQGGEVFGPAGAVRQALALVEAEGDRLNAAVLDINLRSERVYPVAEALAARGVPFVFTTGYDRALIPAAYAQAPLCEKPVDKGQLGRILAHCARRGHVF